MGISSGLLIESFTPQTLTETVDTMGGVTTVWADGTAFRGRLSSLPINESMSADKVTVFASHKLYCNNQTITEAYRIRNSDSTRYFQVKGVVNPSNSNDHLEILVLEID
uniref:Putative head-tail joining protein n=1 Tax=viral metagenome TaxID=1070528 RepID=A0A6M3XW85_9ZZZZ